MAYRNPTCVARTLQSAPLALLLSSFLGQCHAQVRTPAGQQLDTAARLMSDGDWGKAEELLKRLLRTQPNDADALNLLGIAAGKQGRADEAEMDFRKAIAANPSLAAAYLNVAQLYNQRGDGDRALQTLEEGLKHSPHDPPLLAETATLLADRGQFRQAIHRLQATPITARSGDYWELLARLELSAGDFVMAEDSLQRALKSKPESVPMLRQLAGISLKRGDADGAMKYLIRALRLAPNSPELLYEYAQVSLQNNYTNEAVVGMRKALLMEPDRPEFLYFLGSALLDTPDYHEGLPYFRRYVELRPEDPRGHLSLGWALVLEKSYPEARQQLEETLRLDPKQPDAWYHLGMIAYETNDDAKALELLTRTVDLAPGHARGHWGLGMVYSRQGQYEKARDEFERAVKLDHDEPKFHYQLSQTYARLGDAERAGSELQLYKEAEKKSEERINLGQRSPDLAERGQPRP
jgi:tetratricopeptide (TPR) repeat protein